MEDCSLDPSGLLILDEPLYRRTQDYYWPEYIWDDLLDHVQVIGQVEPG